MPNQIIVVLLHGLGKTPAIMSHLEKALIEAGFEVCNLGYPSQSAPIAELAKDIAIRLKTKFPTHHFYFVAHSLGSIIVRYIAMHELLPHIDRVVMLGPPNHGTPVINLLRRFKWCREHWGPAAIELSTDHLGICHQLTEPLTFDCTVIAGNRTIDPWFSWTILKGEDDGKVTVTSTRVAGMKAHIVVATHHAYLPKHPEVITKTIDILGSALIKAK